MMALLYTEVMLQFLCHFQDVNNENAHFYCNHYAIASRLFFSPQWWQADLGTTPRKIKEQGETLKCRYEIWNFRNFCDDSESLQTDKDWGFQQLGLPGRGGLAAVINCTMHLWVAAHQAHNIEGQARKSSQHSKVSISKIRDCSLAKARI